MTPDTRAFSSRSSTRTPPAVVRPWRCCSCRKLRNAEQHQVDHSEKSHYSGPLCNPTRPPPARRRRGVSTSSKQSSFLVVGQDGLMGSSRIGFWRSSMLALLVGLLFLCQGVQAGVYENVFGAEEILPGELLFDRGEPPSLPYVNLEQRDESTYSYEPSTTTIRPSSTSGSASKTSGTLAVATQTGMASLPRPFDSSLGNNFTSTTCQPFFNHFLNNQTFKDCLPLSLLLQVSISYLQLGMSIAVY